jgi:hypothetical protein
MTEAEWLTCDDPTRMLEFLRGKTSDRKLRLFACAWCRKARRHLGDEPGQQALEVAERFADGLVSPEDQERAFRSAFEEVRSRWRLARGPGNDSVQAESDYRASVYAMYTAGTGCGDLGNHLRPEVLNWLPLSDKSGLLREIFGNPFRPATLDPSWLTSTVTVLARGMYDSCDFSAMPILADALQDAGCDSPDSLDHCRGPRSARPRMLGRRSRAGERVDFARRQAV